MKKRHHFVIIALLVFSVTTFTQDESTPSIQDFFQDSITFKYLGGLEEKIQKAAETKDVNSLCVYSSLLAYVEKVTQKNHPKYSAENILTKATEIAWDRENIAELRLAQKAWDSKIFGAANAEASQAIAEYIQELDKKEMLLQEQKDVADMEDFAFSLSKEYAKLDAVEQISEKLFGLIIVFSQDVRGLLEKKQKIVNKLRDHLLTEASFSDFTKEKSQVTVTAQISTQQAIRAIESLSMTEQFDLKKVADYTAGLPKVFLATGVSDF